MPFCNNCGQQYQDGSATCANCGAPLMQQQPVQQNAYPNQQQFAPNQMYNQQGVIPQNTPQPKKKKTSGCVVVIVVIAAIIFWGFVFSSNNDDKTKSKTNTNSEVLQTNNDSSDPDVFDPDNYNELDYNEVIHDSDGLKGQKFTCSGQIIQVLDGSYRLSLENKAFDSDVVLIDYKLSDGESRIAEDDYVTIYGVSKGLETYTAVLGNQITIPRLSVDKLERLSEDDFSKLQFSQAKNIELNETKSTEKFNITLQSVSCKETDDGDTVYLLFEIENISDEKKYFSSYDGYVDGVKVESEYSLEKVNGYSYASYESIESGKKYLGYMKYELPSNWQEFECGEDGITFSIQKEAFIENKTNEESTDE